MAFLYFPGQSVEWLKQKLADLNEESASDKSVIGWSEAGTSASKIKGNVSAETRKRQVLHDLAILDPDGGPNADMGWSDMQPSRASKITLG
jgi:hypothetical protein